MHILVINSGSSSIKYQLILMPEEKVISSGMVERIGFEDAQIHYKTDQNNINLTQPIANHEGGLNAVVALLLDKKIGVIKDADIVAAVGHRVVHGGSTFAKTTIITTNNTIQV